jgi:glutathione S-transferase
MSRRLFVTLRSPFARKAWITLLEKGLAVEPVLVDLANRSPEFIAVSPIGKVPVLVDEDGTVVLDSTVICEYLEDRYPQPALCGPGWQQRLCVRQFDELGDTLAEQAIACFVGRQSGDAAVVSKAENVIARILDALEARVQANGAPICGLLSWADAAVLAALGYATFRLGDGWRNDHPRLAAWFDVMDRRPAAVDTRPRG